MRRLIFLQDKGVTPFLGSLMHDNNRQCRLLLDFLDVRSGTIKGTLFDAKKEGEENESSSG